MASLGSFLLLAAFVVCSYAAVDLGRRRAPPLAPADRERHRRVLPRHRADDGGLGRHRSTRSSPTTSRSSTSRTTRTASSRSSTRSRRTGAGSTARSCSGCSCCRSSASIAVYVNRERHRELIPVRRRDHLRRADVLPVPDDRPQEPVHDVPDDGAGRRRGAEPAAAELLHGDPPAVALHGLRRHDDPVRVRHGGAHHRPPRRLVAARRPPLDDVRVAVPVVRPDARHDLGVRRARLGRLLGLGSGRERRRCCRGSRRPRSCTR